MKVNNYEQRVYSSDRVLHPLKRSGPKGTGQFNRISWDEAMEVIRDRWTGIVGEFGPTAILPYSYLGTEGILKGLNVGDAFFNKLGATISERTFCDSGSCTAYFMTIGPSPGMDPESFKHSKYIILWACNTISTNLHHWPFIAEAKNNGAKLVVIDPVKTRTAREADWPTQLHHAGEQVVIINPKDALARNVGEGSAVRIFNDRGSFEAIAKVSADVMQGIVVAPLGYWRDSSRGKGTVNALSPGVYADLGRAPTFSDTLVEVAVAEVAAAAE